MRGTHAQYRHDGNQFRIIPAYAGNTERRSGLIRPDGDHPRVCGEHKHQVAGLSQATGSSPRMRGTLVVAVVAVGGVGIIPAYAGNTYAGRSDCWTRRDHPRVCGEHLTRPNFLTLPWGSSPRMRGTLLPRHHPGRCAGIIPAYAGNTRTSHQTSPSARDHPRVCGEHPIPHVP